MGTLQDLEADLQALYYETDEALEADGVNPEEYRTKVKKSPRTYKDFW